jgi:hypothetical protein
MIEDALGYWLCAAWLSVSVLPLGFMLGASCSPCCGCGVNDGKPRTDPKDEGTWTFSGDWPDSQQNGSLSASFTANPGDDSGVTWFFYGSLNTSAPGRNATTEEQQDWGNLCNWYSNSLTAPHIGGPDLNKRASRLPPSSATVHIYSPASTASVGPQTVVTAYFWPEAGQQSGSLVAGSELTTTGTAHGTTHGAVFAGGGTVNLGTVSGGAMFNAVNLSLPLAPGQPSDGNYGTVNDGATFVRGSDNWGTVEDGATFDLADNEGTVNGGATFLSGINWDLVNGGAVFDNGSVNIGTVNGGATFNDFASNSVSGTVNGGATFNDAACSFRFTGDYFNVPCDLQYVAHPTDLPTCNGTADSGCGGPGPFFQNCGCG